MPAQEFRWVAGGVLAKGRDARLPEEERGEASSTPLGAPITPVEVAGFWIGTHEVTNGQFAEFVQRTGYITLAERLPPPMPNAPPEMLQAGSAVFTIPVDGNPNWWRWIVGANWKQPHGPLQAPDAASRSTPSSDAFNPRHPVVHIAYEDAAAYAAWKGLSLPTEDQWEWAARSGGADPDAPPVQKNKASANVYQGSFPLQDKGLDGFKGVAPVACFPADDHGVYDMIGNVWEWTQDSVDSDRNVIKGGSFLCASNYCARYRPAARQFQERGLGTDHIGFRLIDVNRAPPAP